MEDVLNYIKLCREALCEVISTYDMRDFDAEKKTLAEKIDRTFKKKFKTEEIN